MKKLASLLLLTLLTIGWAQSQDTPFGPSEWIGQLFSPWHSHVQIGDLDSDGDLDVLAVSNGPSAGVIAWYENTDGRGSFGDLRQIDTISESGWKFGEIQIADGDLDGDMDLFVQKVGFWGYGSFVQFYEHLDSEVKFVPADTVLLGVRWLQLADLDGDRDLDLVTQSISCGIETCGGKDLGVYENKGRPPFDSSPVISSDGGLWATALSDIDGDGDLDVVGAGASDPFSPARAWVGWLENVGDLAFVVGTVVEVGEFCRLMPPADLDMDGDNDLLIVTRDSADVSRISWLKNEDGFGAFSPRQNVIDISRYGGFENPGAGDFDLDGGVDVISSQWVTLLDRDALVYYERAGNSTFGYLFNPPQIIATAPEFFHFEQLLVVDIDGNGALDVVTVVSGRGFANILWYPNTAVGVSTETEDVPEAFSLSQNYPNPFNPTTTISYALPQAADVTLSVYDVLGREIRQLASGRQPAGTYEVTFDATGLSSGVYFYRLETGDYVWTRRMVVLR